MLEMDWLGESSVLPFAPKKLFPLGVFRSVQPCTAQCANLPCVEIVSFAVFDSYNHSCCI